MLSSMKEKFGNVVAAFNAIRKAKPGQVGNAVINLIFAEILIIGAGIPITNNVVDSANLTGLTATIVELVPVFLGVAALAVAANLISR